MNTRTDMNTKLGESAHKAKEAVSDLSHKTTSTAAELTEMAEDHIRESALEAARQQRAVASNYVASLGRAADAAASSLKQDGCVQTARRLEPVSSFLNGSGSSISGYDLRSLVDDATAVAKRNPAVTFGLAALAGYALVKLADTDRSAANDDRADRSRQSGHRTHA